MIEAEKLGTCIDEMGEAGFHYGLFDKRVLFPIEQVSNEVHKETGEQVSLKDVEDMGTRDWLPIIVDPRGGHATRGSHVRPIKNWSVSGAAA